MTSFTILTSLSDQILLHFYCYSLQDKLLNVGIPSIVSPPEVARSRPKGIMVIAGVEVTSLTDEVKTAILNYSGILGYMFDFFKPTSGNIDTVEKSSFLIASTPEVAKVASASFPRKPCFVIPCGITTKLQSIVDKMRPVEIGGYRVGLDCRNRYEYTEVLKVFQSLATSYPKLRTTLIDSNLSMESYRSELINLVPRVDDITISSLVVRAMCDILVVPAFRYPKGYQVVRWMHAGMMGVPCIFLDGDKIQDYVSANTGFFCTTETLQNRILEIASNPKLQKSVGAGVKKEVLSRYTQHSISELRRLVTWIDREL